MPNRKTQNISNCIDKTVITVKSFIFVGTKFRGFPNLDIFVGTNFVDLDFSFFEYAFRGNLKFVV